MATAELQLDVEELFTAIDRKRRRLKMTRKQMAEVLGVSPCAVTFWGARRPDERRFRASCLFVARRRHQEIREKRRSSLKSQRSRYRARAGPRKPPTD